MKQTIITILLALVATAGQGQEPFFCTDSAVVRGADLNEHYRQSPAAERMGRDYMAYRLEQVKSQIYSHYCEKGVRDV